MARVGKQVLGVVVALWALLGAAGVAHAADGIINVTGYATCSSGGVTVENQSGDVIEVRLYLDGNPAFTGNPWISIPNSQSKLISGVAPASGSGTYTTNIKNTVDLEVPLATTPYTTPSYCDDFKVTYLDSCDKVTVTIKNNHGSDVLFTIAQTSGATYPIVDLAVPAGDTKSVDITITAAIHEIGLYLNGPNDYIDRYTPKGLGECGSPTPSVSPSSGGGLPVTGSGLTGLLVMGLVLVVGGAGVVLAMKRARPAV